MLFYGFSQSAKQWGAYLTLLILCLLTGCSTYRDVTGVCKSCKPYFVRGSWHYPQTYYDYEETGLASWYGPGFHGKPKPYGEPYNQYEMTAAHKTLPLPTIAEVTNLETGKTIKVLIDDRGPYVYEGRIIDLSVAAAKELGTYGKGVARVKVKALVEESDKFSKHLTRFKNGRDPTGRRWIHIYQQDLEPGALQSSVSPVSLNSYVTKDEAGCLYYDVPVKKKPEKLAIELPAAKIVHKAKPLKPKIIIPHKCPKKDGLKDCHKHKKYAHSKPPKHRRTK